MKKSDVFKENEFEENEFKEKQKKQKNSDKFQQISKTSKINTIFLDFTDLLLKTINRTVSWFV